MGMYKRVMVLIIFGMANICILNGAFGKESYPDRDGIEDMSEILERERAELDRLKSKLQGTIQIKEAQAEQQKEKGVKEEKSKWVLTDFTEKEVVNKEKSVDEQSGVSPPGTEGQIEEVITLESKDEGVAESERIDKNNEEIIHPFEIAENLYKLGEYKTALEIYQLIEDNKSEKERKMWITYQIANCYRKLELYDEAVEAYGKIRKVYEGTYWAKQAEWNIHDIEWNSKVEEKFETAVNR